MKLNYDFISEARAEEEKMKKVVLSLAGRLMELTDSRCLVILVDNDDKPVVLHGSGRLVNYVDFVLDE